MKSLVLLMLFSMVACTSKTPQGACIGAFDDAKPNLEYKVSKRNVILGLLFVETIIVPAVVVLTETKCPVGSK